MIMPHLQKNFREIILPKIHEIKDLRNIRAIRYIEIVDLDITQYGSTVTLIYNNMSVSQSCLLSFLCNPYISFQIS